MFIKRLVAVRRLKTSLAGKKHFIFDQILDFLAWVFSWNISYISWNTIPAKANGNNHLYLNFKTHYQ